MSSLDVHLLKTKMLEALHPIVDLREASNITSYYFDSVSPISFEELDVAISKLLSGVPVQYVCNNAFFYGHRFYVDNRVLIPRPETEELVHWIIQDRTSNSDQIKVLDIGSGSGCIVISLLLKLTNAKGYAIDNSETSIEVLNLNASKHNIEIQTILSDILDEQTIGFDHELDLIVCNPPYILYSEESRMDNSVLRHEPENALFVSGKDPLLFYRRVLDLASSWLSPNGILYFETSDLYNQELKQIVIDSPFKYEFKKDLQDNWRMLKLWKQ